MTYFQATGGCYIDDVQELFRFCVWFESVYFSV